MNLTHELGVQSWCYRHFKTTPEVIACLKETGLSAIELCGAHADFKDESKFDGIIALFRAADIRIVSIGVQQITGNAAVEEKYFEFVKRAGARFMSVDFPIENVPQSWRMAEKLAEKYDIKLCIHNHGGWHWLGNVQTLKDVFAKTSPRIGLCLDTAWAIDSSEDPIRMTETFKDRLYGMHIKDFSYGPRRQRTDVVAGTGCIDLKGVLGALKQMPFDGYAVLEYEGDVENPVPALKKCVAAVRQAV